MATRFIEPGGDATYGLGLFGNGGGTPAVATDFVHAPHSRSIKFRPNNGDAVLAYANNSPNMFNGGGARFTLYLYLVTLPTSTAKIVYISDNGGNPVLSLNLTSAGVLQLFEASAQIGSNGATLSTGIWYRISMADTIASTSVNEFRVFLNGTQTISVSNATLTRTASSGAINNFFIGNRDSDTTLDFRLNDVYLDDSSALTDPGDILVTVKRPNANGTTNDFGVQIGAGGSGYGSGHSPQVNERANSDSNGWSVAAVAATTEEYNIEGRATGDVDLSSATIIDYVGWIRIDALTNETGQIIVNNVTANRGILSSQISYFSLVAGSATYPAGTGTDIGVITSATATTVRLYECGIIIAYIPSPRPVVLRRNF